MKTVATMALCVYLYLWSQGKASFYGEEFSGKKMANGHLYDPSALTTAHKTLPMGTTVEVCRASKCVDVVVTDRGPWIEGRDFDLSRAAAHAIGMESLGVATVKYRVKRIT